MLFHEKWLKKMDMEPLKWSGLKFRLCGTQEARELLPGQCNIICLDSIRSPPRPSFWRQSHWSPQRPPLPRPVLADSGCLLSVWYFFPFPALTPSSTPAWPVTSASPSWLARILALVSLKWQQYTSQKYRTSWEGATAGPRPAPVTRRPAQAAGQSWYRPGWAPLRV